MSATANLKEINITGRVSKMEPFMKKLITMKVSYPFRITLHP